MITQERLEKIHVLAGKFAGMKIRESKTQAETITSSILLHQDTVESKKSEDPNKRTATMMWGYLVMFDNDYLRNYRGN